MTHLHACIYIFFLSFLLHQKMGEALRLVRIERKTSIESEPMTLSIHQLQVARAAALDVVNTRSTEEALSIFTEGLEPVGSMVKDNGRDSCEEWEWEEHHLPTTQSRDVVSAPF